MEFQENSLNLEYCRASMSKRFVNYIIDSIVVFIILFLIAFTLEILYPGLISESNIGESFRTTSWDNILRDHHVFY